MLEGFNGRSGRRAVVSPGQIRKLGGDFVRLHPALAFFVVGVEEVLAVVADLGFAIEQQYREQSGPVGIRAVGQFTEANPQLPGFVSAQLLDQNLNGCFEVQVFDFEFSADEPLGMTATDPLTQRRHHANPRVGFFCLVRIEQVGHGVDPVRPHILFEHFVKHADDGTAGKYFSTHG